MVANAWLMIHKVLRERASLDPNWTESRLIQTSEEVPIHSGIPLLAYPMLCPYTLSL